MLRTRLCDRLGIDLPILGAPLGIVGGPDLAAAVSNAGGLGLMSFDGLPPPLLGAHIGRLRELTTRPFGVNLILQLASEEHVRVCIEERVPVISFFWGDPTPHVDRIHAAGLLVAHQVGSVAAATQAARAGVDVIIAQGFEAGGHVAGRVTTAVLVPRVVDAVAPALVVAAGGIADARGLVAALALGADGVVLGTRLLATPECGAHRLYKERVVAATEEDTVHTTLFGGGWPHASHRALRTPFVDEWLHDEARGSAERPDEPEIGTARFMGQAVPIHRFASLPPRADTSGDVAAMALYAGQCAGMVTELKPVLTIMNELVSGARRIIGERLAGVVAERQGEGGR